MYPALFPSFLPLSFPTSFILFLLLLPRCLTPLPSYSLPSSLLFLLPCLTPFSLRQSPSYVPHLSYANDKSTSSPASNQAENVKLFMKAQLVAQWPTNDEKLHRRGGSSSRKSSRRTTAAAAATSSSSSSATRRRSRSRRSRRDYDDDDDDDEDGSNEPSLYPHFMCANDTSIVRRVFQDVKHVILSTALDKIGNV